MSVKSYMMHEPETTDDPLLATLQGLEEVHRSLELSTLVAAIDKDIKTLNNVSDNSLKPNTLMVPVLEEKERGNVMSVKPEDVTETSKDISLDLDMSSDEAINISDGNNRRYYLKIGLSLLPEQREQFSYKRGCNFNLMVIGPPGVGKSTFINSLFSEELIETHVPHFRGQSLSISQFELWEDKFPLKLSVIESQSFGDSIDNEGCWLTACNYIDEQFKKYLFQDHQPERSMKMDTRVHCCIYFISPNNGKLSTLDIETMKQLQHRVNLIPVIGKSDCLNNQELHRFKSLTQQLLQLNEILVCNFLQDEELIDRINEGIPFSIIGSTEFHDTTEGVFKCRKYDWGLVNIEDDNICDFNQVKALLIDENMLDFILSTENHYNDFKQNFINDIYHVSPTDTEALKIYKILDYQQYRESFKENDPIIQYKQDKLKAQFNTNVKKQEKRFKDWKKALVHKQNELNDDIELLHNYLIKLQDMITLLEEGVDIEDHDFNDYNNFTTTHKKHEEIEVIDEVDANGGHTLVTF